MMRVVDEVVGGFSVRPLHPTDCLRGRAPVGGREVVVLRAPADRPFPAAERNFQSMRLRELSGCFAELVARTNVACCL